MFEQYLQRYLNFVRKFSPRYIAPEDRTSDNINPQVVAYSDSLSYVSEQYRTICCKLIAEPDEKVILITSSQPKEGKTTTACNLAAIFASTLGLKTILIDCDLRRPCIHEMFGLKKKVGLTDIINGKAKLDEFTKKPAVRDLYVIPSGSSTKTPEVLLNAPKMRDILESLKKDFDRIIIDTPPVLKTADVQALGPVTDSVLFIVQGRVTPRHMIEESFSVLRNTDSMPTACILTNAERIPNYYTFITKPVYRYHYMYGGNYYGAKEKQKTD